jgi:putative phosphoribosyl transferase|tara:strand:+ start:12048 stop:12707 length:660 start_codon:yes stop_codon:yes gene_type:complete
MMYFHNRTEAGEQLARLLLDNYRYENVAIVALGDGAVTVSEPIAERLHCILTLLVSEDVEVPGENQKFGAVSQTGQFTYNSALDTGEISEYTTEYHGYLEEQKREAFQKINRLIGDGGIIDRDLLQDHTIILVSDGLQDVTILNVAIDFLKPVRVQKLVIAAPVVSVEVVDKMHIIADELHILDVKANYIDTDHYYDQNDLPSHEETIKKINRIILNWR